MLPKNRKLVRRLHDVRIDEVSAVDKSASFGTKIMLRKSASIPNAAMNNALKRLAVSVNSIVNDPDCNKSAMLTKSFMQFQEHLNELSRKNLDVSIPPAEDDEGYDNPDRATDDDEPTDNDGADPNGAPTKHLNDLVEQLDKQQKDQTMRDPMRKLKSLDAVRICKQMVAEEDAHSISEHDLVAMVDNYAKAHSTTFAKLYEAQDDTGLAIRKAVDIAKHAGFGVSSPYLKAATLAPKQVGGADARSVDDPRSALDQINDLIAEQRRQHPELELSDAQWFARVYSDPANRDIAKRERAENRP
jgi:hypothetical protein